MKLRLLGGVEGRSTDISPESCINLFYEKGESGESLVNVPGSTEFVDLGNGEVRGGIEYNELAYFVAGSTLYEVSSAGTATSRGTLTTSSGRVSMAHNGVRTGGNQQIFIADGTQRYIYDNTTSTLTGYTDYAAVTVVYIDGYFLFNIADSDKFYLTSQYDGVTVNALDFETAEGDPDEIQSLVADQRQLHVLGVRTMSNWYNSGDTDNTFQRYQGGFKQTGCAAKFSPARLDNNICWLSRNDRGHAQVVKLGESYLPTVISTPELDYQMAQYTTISDAFGYSYQFEGHEFYVLTFPSEKRVWAYDASNQRWHQRGHTISGVFPNRERYNCHVFAFGQHLFGDYNNGKIYKMDSSVNTFNTERVPRELVTPNITEEEQRFRISSVQLDMQEGTGDPNDATDTSIWLSYSKDGGHTYGNEIDGGIGDAGKYSKRVIWRRLGWGRNWTFKIRTWTPNKVVLKGLYVRPYGK
jgi:hypothetical protein